MNTKEQFDNHQANNKSYWQANLSLIFKLLSVWALVSLGGSILFVKFLNQFHFFGLPLGFWLAQQGAVCIFVVLIFVYSWQMDKIDRAHHLEKDSINNTKKS